MQKRFLTWGSLSAALLALGAVGACSAGTSDGAVGGGGPGTGGSGATGQGGNASTTTGNAGGSNGAFMTTAATGQNGCDASPDEDQDQDGFTITQGDCNDCDPNVNPGAIEVIIDPGMGQGGAGGAEPADENCNDQIDEVEPDCDAGIPITTSNALDGARSVDLCKQATGPKDYGVVSAQWTRANGTPANVNYQMGVLPDFGPNVLPRRGSSLLALSSGAARDLADPGFCSHSCGQNGAGTPPAGFPQDVPGCSGLTNINDDVALDVTLRAPTNATGYKFDFRFYSNEYPEFVCTSFNDQFIALVNPAPMGAINGNISFDSMNNPVSVNIAFFDVCQGCPLGTAELEGTDFFSDEGGTSWLQTTAPVTGGDTFNIRFAIWDTGDSSWDSTVLVDNFQWIANGGTVAVGTNPVPE